MMYGGFGFKNDSAACPVSKKNQDECISNYKTSELA